MARTAIRSAPRKIGGYNAIEIEGGGPLRKIRYFTLDPLERLIQCYAMS